MLFCVLCSSFQSRPRSLAARERLRRLKVNHGWWFGYRHTPESSRVLQCLVDVQAQSGGDSPIGRRL